MLDLKLNHVSKRGHWKISQSHICLFIHLELPWIPIIKESNQDGSLGSLLPLIHLSQKTQVRYNRHQRKNIILDFTDNPLSQIWCISESVNQYLTFSRYWPHGEFMTWKCFLHYWPFVKGIHQSPVDSHYKGPVRQSFDVFFDVSLNKLLKKQSSCQWFAHAMMLMPGHYNDVHTYIRPNFVITAPNKSHGTAYINLDKIYPRFPSLSLILKNHDDVIKWKHFPPYWPFVRGIHRSPVNSPHKGQWWGA